MSAEQNVTEIPVAPVSQANSDDDGFNGSGGGFELDENGQRVPHGMGISKSSRRRRRKRKGKTTDAVAGTGEGSPSAGGESEVVAGIQAAGNQAGGNQAAGIQSGAQSAAPASAPQQAGQQGFRQNGGQGRSFNGQQNNNGTGQTAPGGTKRWKKKFRDRDRQGTNGGGQQQGGQSGQNGNGGGGQQQGFQANGGFRGPDTHQPGNSVGGFKRKGGFGSGGSKQQRSGGGGSRGGFVGPMDHSYRVVNGNVFDGGVSTIDLHQGGGRGRSYQSDSQPIDYSQGRVVPIAEGTPTKIYFFIEDLFFTAKIQETARKLGVKVAFIKNEKEQIAALTSGEGEDLPGLIVFDLNNANAKPMTLIPKLKTKLKKTTSIIGFLSHLQGDLKAKAVEAGCDTVMPRAAFSQNLPNLLRRYGIEETEEPNFNQ